MPGMAPWSPVALPPRFVAARRTRLVGRRYEHGVMETVWERAAQGAGQVLLVGGEPGAGKTITLLVGIGPEARVDHYFTQCRRCWMRDCAYRRAPAVATVRR